METLKNQIIDLIKPLFSNLNVKVDKGYLNVTFTNKVELIQQIKTLYANLQTEFFIGLQITFTLNEIRIKNSLNRYEKTDCKPLNISFLLSLNHFHINETINYNDANGETQSFTLNEFRYSQFIDYIEAQNVEIVAISIK